MVHLIGSWDTLYITGWKVKRRKLKDASHMEVVQVVNGKQYVACVPQATYSTSLCSIGLHRVPACVPQAMVFLIVQKQFFKMMNLMMKILLMLVNRGSGGRCY